MLVINKCSRVTSLVKVGKVKTAPFNVSAETTNLAWKDTSEKLKMESMRPSTKYCLATPQRSSTTTTNSWSLQG